MKLYVNFVLIYIQKNFFLNMDYNLEIYIVK